MDHRLTNIETNWRRPAVAEDLASVNALEPFSLLSLYVGGPAELSKYTEGGTVFTDDRSALEFSAPRELHSRGAGENAANLTALMGSGGRDDGPDAVRVARANASARNWHNRATMMFKSDMFTTAYDDEVRALAIDPADEKALNGLVDAAVMTGRYPDAILRMKSAEASGRETAGGVIAHARLLAASGSRDDALMMAKKANAVAPRDAAVLEELASLYTDKGDMVNLGATVAALEHVAPGKAPTLYYQAVSAFLRRDYAEAVARTNQAIAADPSYAAVYDLAGAAAMKAGDAKAARSAFARSLHFNGHDSSAYTNLGLIELAAGNRAEAARNFIEALWLDPESENAHQGLLEAQSNPR
jgi:tetratricopeptide (TPR) repeat protein